MKKITVRNDSYYDSVFLMLATRELKETKGVKEAVVAMGTPMNLNLLVGMGFAVEQLSLARPNDLVIALDAETGEAADQAVSAALAIINRKKDPAVGAAAGLAHAGSFDSALKTLPDANLALISVPGLHAARATQKAIERGLHVMLFSDNVPLDDEINLKRLAVSKGLLLMGPDCGTAIINGNPVCFANVVRRGPVGIVAASGTGLQEVSCLIDRFGSGISQAIGTGSRDLKDARVAGMTTLLALEALKHDPGTKVLVVISKPPIPEIAAKVTAVLKTAGKPAVVFFLGLAGERKDDGNLTLASSLEETALLACAFASGACDAAAARAMIADRVVDMAAVRARALEEAKLLLPGQKYVRGLYMGGTLCDEALFVLHGTLGDVKSNNHVDPAFVPIDPRVSEGNVVIDLGDDYFTVGKPHPMIDPGVRLGRILQDGRDKGTAVILLDIVLGYGSHPDPAGACIEAIGQVKAAAKKRGGHLSVVASVTGTPADPQGLLAQASKLEGAGVIVMPSNYRAALLALEIIRAVRAGVGVKK
jgi:FdrA protein